MPLDTVVVGAGVVSDSHLYALEESPLTNAVAICDLDEGRAERKAAEYGVRWYTDLDSMIEAEDVDWLHVCTPVQSHLDVALTAIEAGIPTQIEKPVTETVEEVERIEAAAEEHGVPVSVVHNHNFDRAIRGATSAVNDGEVGAVRSVDLVFTGETPPDLVQRGSWTFELPGGEFEEGIPHPFYLLLRSGGYPATANDIQAITTCSKEYEDGFTYDGVRVQYSSEDGVLCGAVVLAGSIPNRVLHVHGDDGAIMADLISQTVVSLDRDYLSSPIARAQNNFDRIRDRLVGTAGNVRAVAERRFDGSWETEKELSSHFFQIDAEARALVNGEPPVVPLSEGKWTIAMMEAVRERAGEVQSTETPPARTS